MSKKGTEELTYISHFTSIGDEAYQSRRKIRPMVGCIAIDFITNYGGEEDIDDLFGENDFEDNSDMMSLYFSNDFDIKP